MSKDLGRYSLLQLEGSGLSESVGAESNEDLGRRQDAVNLTPILSPGEDQRTGRDELISSETFNPEPAGLGIINRPRPLAIHRVPVGSKLTSPTSNGVRILSPTTTPQTPGSGEPLLSHLGQNQERGRYRDVDGLNEPEQVSSQGVQGRHSRTHSDGNFQHQFSPDDDTAFLRLDAAADLENGLSKSGCPSTKDIHTSRRSCLSVTILALSIYSTVMSGLWLVAAFIQPRWGLAIHSNGSLSPSTASLLSAFLAKTIELSFVTVFVGFIGQVLSRRSLVKGSRGVTLAEMSMRTWIIQPGSLLMNGETLRFAGLTFLGIISLAATVVALLYTTASDALVSPKLQFGTWDNRLMQGFVKTSYANPNFVASQCETPITSSVDPDSGFTCLAIEHAGNCTYFFL